MSFSMEDGMKIPLCTSHSPERWFLKTISNGNIWCICHTSKTIKALLQHWPKINLNEGDDLNRAGNCCLYQPMKIIEWSSSDPTFKFTRDRFPNGNFFFSLSSHTLDIDNNYFAGRKRHNSFNHVSSHTTSNLERLYNWNIKTKRQMISQSYFSISEEFLFLVMMLVRYVITITMMIYEIRYLLNFQRHTNCIQYCNLTFHLQNQSVESSCCFPSVLMGKRCLTWQDCSLCFQWNSP